MGRRLAAIAFVDIVEFSKQVSRDEAAGLERRGQVEAVVRAAAAEYGRRVESLAVAALAIKE